MTDTAFLAALDAYIDARIDARLTQATEPPPAAKPTPDANPPWEEAVTITLDGLRARCAALSQRGYREVILAYMTDTGGWANLTDIPETAYPAFAERLTELEAEANG